MSDDALETRKIARNWREYLTETKDSLLVFVWVWRELIGRSSKRLAFQMAMSGLAATLLSIGQAWPFARVIDGIVGRDLRRCLLGLVTYTTCLLASQLFQYLFAINRERLIGLNIRQRDRRMNELFFAKSLGQHMRDGSVLSVGGMEKAKGKVNLIQDMMLFNGFSALLDLLVVYIFIWTISSVAALAMTALLTVMFVSGLHMSQRCVETCTPIEIDWSRYNRTMAERWEKIERVKTNGQEAAETETAAAWCDRIFVNDLRFWSWFIRMSNWRGLLEKIVLAATVGYGVWRVWQGDWTVGLLYPLFSWCGMFANNMWRIAAIEREVNWALPAVKVMKDALTMSPDITDKPDALELHPNRLPRIEFRDVGHTYVSGKLDDGEAKSAASAPVRPVLTNLTLTIEPGEKVAFVGTSGAGKTTVMRLIQRYMDPDQGTILVDGRDLRDYNLKSWIDALAYIPQQAQIMDGTIRSNLLYGLSPDERAKVEDADLWKIMDLLRIDFGERLTDGLETRVGRNGIKLSGGEAQRLMIGAAVIRRPRIMIIDEATSNLDSTTEKAVQHGLSRILSGDMSAFIIAHRLSTVRHLCTKFVVLKSSEDMLDGDRQIEAVASSFEELYRLSPTFRRLADDQDIAVKQLERRPVRHQAVYACAAKDG